MLLKTVGIIIGIVFLFGCASQTGSPVNSERNLNRSTGFLQGTVSIGPICPVESIEDPCLPDPGLFTSHQLLILTIDGKEVQRVNIDGEGKYRTELNSGEYRVDFTPHDIGIPGSFQPPLAEIREGETTILNIDIDTGIR